MGCDDDDDDDDDDDYYYFHYFIIIVITIIVFAIVSIILFVISSNSSPCFFFGAQITYFVDDARLASPASGQTANSVRVGARWEYGLHSSLLASPGLPF